MDSIAFWKALLKYVQQHRDTQSFTRRFLDVAGVDALGIAEAEAERQLQGIRDDVAHYSLHWQLRDHVAEALWSAKLRPPPRRLIIWSDWMDRGGHNMLVPGPRW